MYVTVEGWRLWVSRRRPTAGTHCRGTVLLLHGFPDTHALWDSQVAALTAAGWATIAPDMPGFGRSAQPQEVGRYKLGALVSLMLALLDQLLGAGAAAAVVAHDWGAAVAWALALRAPERVQRLVVLSVGHPGGAPDPAQRARRWYQLFFLLPGAEAALGADGLLRQVLGADRSCSDAVLDEYVQRLAQPGALTAALNWYRANITAATFGRQRPWPVTHPLAVPTLGVWSSEDVALLEPQMLASRAYLAPGCWRYERIEGAGHWIPRDAPGALNALLLDFLSDGGRAGGGRPRL